MGGVLRALSPREELIAELEEAGFDLWEETPQDWRATLSDEQLRAAVKVAREAPAYPDISELVAAIEQAEPALAEAQRMVCGNDFTDDRSLFQSTPFFAPLKLCRETLSDIAKAQEATK